MEQSIQSCHETLAAALPDLDKRRRLADATVTQISAMQKRLLDMLPELQKAALRAPNNSEGKEAQRKYLRCRQNITRCEQAFQMARKNQMQIKAMLPQNAI